MHYIFTFSHVVSVTGPPEIYKCLYRKLIMWQEYQVVIYHISATHKMTVFDYKF
jgi:hypothetical protein